ncbi:uncharacterized protein G2W53_014086 [Senna tora]|uniref:Uncharacterized protein n=1 Tax=Senna tora TaxID=362788 RepID=A0A834WRK9_9FABA|nr:uncharacterized protein G2W53_014086 [Senna tora]
METQLGLLRGLVADREWTISVQSSEVSALNAKVDQLEKRVIELGAEVEEEIDKGQDVDGIFTPIPSDKGAAGLPSTSDDSTDSAGERGGGSVGRAVSPRFDCAPNTDSILRGDPSVVIAPSRRGSPTLIYSDAVPTSPSSNEAAVAAIIAGNFDSPSYLCLAILGVQTHTFIGNDGVGYFIHGPPMGHMLHLDLNYRHGQTDVTCDYVLNFQTIPVGGEPVTHPPAPGHPLLVPFGYPRDPAGFQVLIWNVRDISLGFNCSLVCGLIATLNPAVVILTDTQTRDLEGFVPFVELFDFGSNVLRRSVPGGSARGGVWVLYREGLITNLFRYRHRHLEISIGRAAVLYVVYLAMTSPRHLAAFHSRLEGVTPPPVRSILADEYIRVLRFRHGAERFGFFIRAPRNLVLSLEVNFVLPPGALRGPSFGNYGYVLRVASGFDFMSAFVRDLRPSVLILVERDAQDAEVLARFAQSLGYSIVVSRWDSDDRQSCWVFCRFGVIGPSQFTASFPSVGSVRARVASLSTKSPTSSFRCLTFQLCASAAFCLYAAVLMLAMSRSSSARSRLTFKAA